MKETRSCYFCKHDNPNTMSKHYRGCFWNDEHPNFEQQRNEKELK
jgi:hypothetical protein